MIDITISLLHTGPPPTGWLHSDWRFQPAVLLSTFLAAAAYILVTGPINRRFPGSEHRPVTSRQRVYFLLACLVYLIALGPPIDDWSGFYLMSAHMLQHLLIMMVVAPLLILGIPAWMLAPLARNRYTNTVISILTRPLIAGAVSLFIVILWHLPGAYDRSLTSDPVHIAQHASLLAAGVLMLWPVLSPFPWWPKIQYPPLQCLYLFLYMLPSGIVGAFITLAAPGVYPFYKTVPRIFGISLEVDQQVAGLMMWVGQSTILLLWITYIFLSWAGREEAADREARPAEST
ncbi:MAG: cytochrome c oxidase assembly protein [Thermomicrobiales bacterium]|nr:cytochrome c oxidase assembly protein [Thermomicrobiales bacterium]